MRAAYSSAPVRSSTRRRCAWARAVEHAHAIQLGLFHRLFGVFHAFLGAVAIDQRFLNRAILRFLMRDERSLDPAVVDVDEARDKDHEIDELGHEDRIEAAELEYPVHAASPFTAFATMLLANS